MSLLTMFKTPSLAEPAPAARDAAAPDTETLEDVLLDLAKWGQPRVGIYGMDGLWHCNIEVNVTPVGVKFEAKSGFKCKTPIEAALECRKNLQDAVKAIGGAA
jgi:hypothetical protein